MIKYISVDLTHFQNKILHASQFIIYLSNILINKVAE